VFALAISQISHFTDVAIPNDSAKTRQLRIIDENDTTIITAPNERPLFGLEIFFTKYAISHGKNVNENGI
jgi:hypothetical protein